ncbi:MAG: UbiD family decarboxylase, partial [Dehalococcoidia bacterium]|nr:UbiD family decarboxylase [Dehalococcoidia bacterium]
PVQEVIIEGEQLKNIGLGFLPSPVENPGWSGDIRTTNQFVTKDPETGIRNIGTYSGHFSGPATMRWGLSPYHHANTHWEKARALGKKLQVAIVIGALPNIVFAATAPAPYGVDEYTLAGAIAGEPVKLVKCKTVDLEVPATAEYVIEGEVSNEYLEPKVAFGDYPGYVYEVENALGQVIDVTCITHRRNAIFTAQVVGYHLNDTSIQGGLAREAGLYKHLKYDCYIPGVLDVAMPPGGGESNMVVVQIKKSSPWQPWQVLSAIMGYDPGLGKISIVVDEDINPRDPQMINWALSFSMQPHRDIRIVTQRTPNLDASGYPPGASREERRFPSPSGSSAVLIDATRKWPYAPVGMPKKEFMEKALKIWQEANLPRLNLRKPWYGYPLGRWTERDEQNAQLTL